MTNRVWHMNADFEIELAANSDRYKRPDAFSPINRGLAERMLFLAAPGDVLLIDPPWGHDLVVAAEQRGVELVRPSDSRSLQGHIFTPWGWSRTSISVGESIKAILKHPELEVVRRVNSKLWSFALESELGIATPGSATAASFEELSDVVARACPGSQDKWVIKSPYGFAARDRVLGRGPDIQYAQAKWAQRRFERTETLLFQPWLEVVREYGIAMQIGEAGDFSILGVSDLQTNGAGTGIGYILGSRIESGRLSELESIAATVANRLLGAGYFGPVGIDALEHSCGFLPLLEINARYTMGFIALAVERSRSIVEPVFWSTK